eukprot:6488884-Amphidinium_carterae.1
MSGDTAGTYRQTPAHKVKPTKEKRSARVLILGTCAFLAVNAHTRQVGNPHTRWYAVHRLANVAATHQCPETRRPYNCDGYQYNCNSNKK